MLLCVSFGLTNQVWNYFEYCLCKTYFVFEILKGEWLKILILGKLGLNLVFWKNISSHTHAFLFLIFNALRSVFKNQVSFPKKMFFPYFRLIQTVFQSIEISFKIFDEPLSVSIDRNCFFDWSKLFFRSIEYCESGFLKFSVWPVQNTFSKVF